MVGGGAMRRTQVVGAVLLGLCVAVAVVSLGCLGGGAVRAPDVLQQRHAQQLQSLWWGAGVSDDLNRMVKIGKAMSPHLRARIENGSRQQAATVAPSPAPTRRHPTPQSYNPNSEPPWRQPRGT